MMKKLFTKQIMSEQKYSRLGQMVCFVAALLIPVLVFRRFGQLELSETQLLLAVIVTMSMALGCVLLGMVMELRMKLLKA